MWRVGSFGRVTRFMGAGAVVGGLMLAAGCSSNSPSASSTSTSAAVQTVNAPQDAKVTSCKAQNKVWLMTGSLHNSSTTPRKYTLTINFDTGPGQKVLVSRTISTAKLGAGASTTFGASAPINALGVACLIGKVTATA